MVIFLHFWRFFVYLFPQKACLKLFIFFLFCFFAFVFPFKNPFSSLLFVHQPLLEKTLCGVLLFFFCSPFPFLMFACLFETNFPNIPFFKPKLLSLLAVYFFFCCSCFYFHGVCFSLSVSMLALFWVFCFFFSFVPLFLSCCLFCSQSMKKLFPMQFWCFFWVMLFKRVVCFFLCFMFLFLFVFLVLFVPFIELICIILFLCCCFVTKLSGLLVCILWSFFFFCFLFCFEFVFVFHSSQKKTPQKTGHSKNPKKQKCWKTDKKSVSAVVFTNSVL